MSKAEEIDKIYKKAKAARVVLNKEEFAKKLGYSRIHLYRILEGYNEATIAELLTKAKKLVGVTKAVTEETNLISEPEQELERKLPDKELDTDLEKEFLKKENDYLKKINELQQQIIENTKKDTPQRSTKTSAA